MKIRQIGIVALACALLAPVTSASAGPGRPTTRVVERPYESGGIGAYVAPAQSGGWYFDCFETTGCVIVPVKPKDVYVDFEIEDESGLAVYAQVRAIGVDGKIAEFCTRTGERLSVDGYYELLVHLIAGVCPDGTPSAPTSGVVTATFTSGAK